MACALDFLDRYHKEGDQFLERIVTGDETWVSHIAPESKRQSMEWRHTNSPVRVKAKRKSQHARLWQPCFGIDMGSC
ncbi:uncharacterized protein TNCV_3194501 [Trichonephila clavipes]|uniref:Histone-lysine N-methyltransferase SETMAR n=1 Tax=Trichonephila clavipes TaxID=2585209 RepID=A0A8X6V0D6_TRICX|nr:uncharacterized protein TNCV_3194501 [Trichonephila clavipes]